MSLCTFCPANTIRCAHLDGAWIRIVREYHSEYYTYGLFWSWPMHCSDVGFHFSNLTSAKEGFHIREHEMRRIGIIAKEVSGDD